MENKEKKTKELNLEKNTKSKTKEVNEKSKEKVKDNKKPSNSFYEETSEVSLDVKWYKDWRGKTLILTLAGALLIAGGIPSGMAISGYWKKFKGDQIPYNPSKYEQVINRIKVDLNTAYIEQLSEMTDEGWFTESQKKLIVKNAKNDADDQVKNEKKSVKNQYGKVWEDAWTKQLQEKGFNNDQEYKDSIIAGEYKSKISSQYTDISNIVKKSSTDLDAKYKSGKAMRGDHWEYINNSVPNENIDSSKNYVITPEKLMDVFIYLYQPILFNDTLMEFTPSKSQDGEADIAANTISFTNDQILNTLDMYYNLTDDNYEQFSNNYGDVMSASNLSFEDTATTVSLNKKVVDDGPFYPLSESNKETNELDLTNIITTAFADLDIGDINNLTKDDIDTLTSTQDETFSESVRSGLVTANLIQNSSGGKRDFYSKWSKNGDYLSFISTDGLHSVGIQNHDTGLIEDYLNIKNKSDGWVDLASSSIDSKFSEWVSTNLDKFIFYSWSMHNQIFTPPVVSPELITALTSSRTSLQNAIDSKNAAKTFYTDNFQYYNLSAFDENTFLMGMMKNSHILKLTWDLLPSEFGNDGNGDLNNEVTKGGNYEE